MTEETLEMTYQEAINYIYEKLPKPGTMPEEGIFFRDVEEGVMGRIKEQYPTTTRASDEGMLVVVSIGSEHRLHAYHDIAKNIAEGDWQVLK